MRYCEMSDIGLAVFVIMSVGGKVSTMAFALALASYCIVNASKGEDPRMGTRGQKNGNEERKLSDLLSPFQLRFP